MYLFKPNVRILNLNVCMLTLNVCMLTLNVCILNLNVYMLNLNVFMLNLNVCMLNLNTFMLNLNVCKLNLNWVFHTNLYFGLIRVRRRLFFIQKQQTLSIVECKWSKKINFQNQPPILFLGNPSNDSIVNLVTIYN